MAADLSGYLVCSRYDQVFHLMNIAVDPSFRRRGIAKRLLETMVGRAGTDASYTLEVRTSNAPAIALYERFGFRRRRDPATLLPGHRRGRPDHVADRRAAFDLNGRRLAAADDDVILALETSCDDTCAAVVSAEGMIASNVISSQGIHDRYGGVVPEIASRHHLDLIGDAVDDALARAKTTLDEIELIAVTCGPGLVGALLVGVATAKALAATRELPLAGVDHLHGHVAASFLEPAPFAPPFLSLIASGGHTMLATVTDRGPGFEVIGQTLDDAAGEAFDKGARLLGLGYPGGARSSASRRTAILRRSRFRPDRGSLGSTSRSPG